MSKNRIRLDICGIECTLGSDDSESYIRSIAEEVEKAITAMQRQNEHLSTAAAAVFASLNFCDDAHKAQASADNLRTQIRDYVEDASRARLEADEARREIERLNRELQTLRARWNAESEDGEEGGEPEEKPAPRRQKAQQHPAGARSAPASATAGKRSPPPRRKTPKRASSHSLRRRTARNDAA